MKTQVYDLNTKLNFGKHAGKTIMDLFNAREARYIGYLIFSDIKRFILHPNTIEKLNQKGFFDDMPVSYYGSCGWFSSKDIVGISKADIIENLLKNYQEYIDNPKEYEAHVNEEIQNYYNNKKRERQSGVDDLNNDYRESKYDKYGGYNGFSDDTIDDAFEGDPSNTWNVV